MKEILKSIIIGDWETYMKYLESNGEINIRDREGRSPLINAVSQKRLDIVEILIQKNSDINLQDNRGYSALHFAAKNYLLEIAKLLIENDAIVDVEDKNGNTPLSDAVFDSRGRGEMIKFLIFSGADKNLKNHHGVSPLSLANSIANFNVSQYFE